MNAKIEFLKHINPFFSIDGILCSQIRDIKSGLCAILTTGWDKKDLEDFLEKIDFEYDDGYGGQELYGTIWYIDGTWSSRVEYDGSEWWNYYSCPNIPIDLNRVDKVRDKKLNDIGI